MSAGFTPGPWAANANAYGCWFVHGGKEYETPLGTKYRALVCGGNDHSTLNEANARLIAAAPALHKAADLLASFDATGDEAFLRDAIRAAREALAIVRGEQ
jgi:hypothetical protein